MKQWYEELFLDFSENYEKESFTQGTSGEVDFFEKELNSDRSSRILDIGCGTGRHSLELARRGYNITGIDLSESMISKAKEHAEKKNLKTLHCNERYYVPSEITWLLKSAGFRSSEIFGCKLGAFSRNDKLSTEDFEMLVIALK